MALANSNKGKGSRATRAQNLIAGARKHFANGGQNLTFAGGFAAVSVDAAVANLQKIVDNRAATTAAQATAKDAVAAERNQAPALVAFMNAFEELVRFMFATDTKSLGDFGLTPHKAPAPKTTEQKAVAAAKRKATRAARGTTSAKAKQAIHGNVTASIVVTPVGNAGGADATVPAATPPAPGGAAAAGPPVKG
jgi:hypothetical protein